LQKDIHHGHQEYQSFLATEFSWVKYNGRTIALMPSHVGSDPQTKSVLYVHNVVGYQGKTFAPVEINIGDSFTLYDVKFTLTESRTDIGSDISYKYDVKKATKSAPVDLQLNTTTQFNFETVLKHTHDGADYYLTLGSIGERRVDFFIWNSALEVIESLSFRSSKWCKVGDFVFSLQDSTNDTARLLIKKQTTRDTSLGNIALSFDEIIRVKHNDNLVTMQVLKMGLLHPGYFDMWCTLDVAGQSQITGYLKDMRERENQQFAVTYSIECKSIEHPADSAPKYNLEVKVVDSPEVNFNEEFTLMKDKSVQVKGVDLKIRFDGSSHKRKVGGGAVGFFQLTTTLNKKEEQNRYQVEKDGTAEFTIGPFNCNLIKTQYDQSVTLVIKQVSNKREC
jgi:hypothetical protein